MTRADQRSENCAVSYSRKSGAYVSVDYTPLNFVYGEDGIYTTLDDMVKWVKAVDERRLIKTGTWELAFTPGKLNSGVRTHYGCRVVRRGGLRLAQRRVAGFPKLYRSSSRRASERGRAIKLQGTRCEFAGRRRRPDLSRARLTPSSRVPLCRLLRRVESDESTHGPKFRAKGVLEAKTLRSRNISQRDVGQSSVSLVFSRYQPLFISPPAKPFRPLIVLILPKYRIRP